MNRIKNVETILLILFIPSNLSVPWLHGETSQSPLSFIPGGLHWMPHSEHQRRTIPLQLLCLYEETPHT